MDGDDKDLPGSVLFACNLNAVRSPMAEAMVKHLYGTRIFVDSVGLEPREINPFAVSVMEEIGIDLAVHAAKSFDDLDPGAFDLIVALTPETHARAEEFARARAIEVDHWDLSDPTEAKGSRAQRLDAFRQVRDDLLRRIKQRFGTASIRQSATD